jgi:hypothetical protein
VVQPNEPEDAQMVQFGEDNDVPEDMFIVPVELACADEDAQSAEDVATLQPSEDGAHVWRVSGALRADAKYRVCLRDGDHVYEMSSMTLQVDGGAFSA